MVEQHGPEEEEIRDEEDARGGAVPAAERLGRNAFRRFQRSDDMPGLHVGG